MLRHRRCERGRLVDTSDQSGVCSGEGGELGAQRGELLLFERHGATVARTPVVDRLRASHESGVQRCGVVRARTVVAMLALAVASCGVRTPSRIDVAALVARRGAEARHDLAVRIVADPRDIAARLALAELDERDRPSSAIEQLEAVDALGGPIGTRWRDADRARLARLVATRGRARLAREASTALADFDRAAQLGGAIEKRERDAARALSAIAQLRHVDPKVRAAGMRVLAELWTAGGDRRWAGARSAATQEERGVFGVMLWSVRARRAAWEELSAWHDAVPAPRDPVLAAAYLTARAWWIPYDGPAPADDDLVGPDRCRFASCDVAQLVEREPLDEAALAAILAAPPNVRKVDGKTAAAWMQLTLLQALRGEASWGPALSSRVELATLETSSLPAPFRATFAFLANRTPVAEVPLAELDKRRPITTSERLVFAAGRALRGATEREVSAALGESRSPTADAGSLLGVVMVPTVTVGDPFVTAAAANARVRVPHGLTAPELRAIATGYLRDPAVADRLGADAVARAVDASEAHASVGALFDAIGDPARARIAWQAAVDLGPEVSHLRGLAEAIARAKDPDAALVAAVAAAAAWGDPAEVWTSVARSLEATGEHVHALDAARSAIGLASSRTLVAAIDVAIEASTALGRTGQVAELTERRGRITPPVPVRLGDPTDAAAALVAHDQAPSASSTAQLWVTARWNRRHVGVRAALLAATSPDDPRYRAVVGELVALASDADTEVGRAAVNALRAR